MDQRKTFRAQKIEWKADRDGTGRAVIATFNAVDKDQDVTAPGAFPVGKEIVISSYGHSSWDGGMDNLPIGKGVLGANDQEAWVDFELFLNTPQGKAHYETLKALGDLCEWSYGFRPLEYSVDPEELAPYPKAWRILKRLDVYEASPVLLGAGVNTRTESLKQLSGLTLADHEALARAAGATLAERYSALAAELRKDGRALSTPRRDRVAQFVKSARDVAAAATAVADELEQLLDATDPERHEDAGKSVQALHLEWLRRGFVMRALAS